MLRRIGAEEGGEFKAIASGTLPSGRPVIVNADGTVSVVSETTITDSVGTNATFTSAQVDETAIAFDSIQNKHLIVFRDTADSYYAKAVVATVASDGGITFGSIVTISSAFCENIRVAFDSANGKFLVVFKTGADSNYGNGAVATISGTSVSFGSFTSFNAIADQFAIAFDSNAGKFGVFYRRSNQNYARTATISGTSVSFGSEVNFNASNGIEIGVAFDSTNNKFVVAYRDQGNSDYGECRVATISGTSISFGTMVVFNSASTIYNPVVHDVANNKIVIAYRDSANSNYGTARVGTISGTDISFGSEVTFDSSGANYVGANYDSAAEKVVISYNDIGDSNKGKIVVGTVSGTSISFGSENVFSTNATIRTFNTFDSNVNRSVIVYVDEGSSYDGEAVSFQAGYTSRNLTSENYIGMSRGVVDVLNQTLGSTVVFEAGNTTILHSTFDSNSNRVVFSYRDGGNSSHGTAVVGEVNAANHTISFGTPVVFNAATTGDNIDLTFDSNSNKVVIAYRDEGASDYGKAIVGTVDPSDNSISFGTEATFESAEVNNIGITFDNNSNKVVIGYGDVGNSRYGTAIVGTVSGTDITFGTAAVFESARTENVKAAFDSNNNKVVFAYRDHGNSYYGTAIVGTVSGTSISFGSATVFVSASFEQPSIVYATTDQKTVISFRDDTSGTGSNDGTAIVGTVSGTSISFGTSAKFETGTFGSVDSTYDVNLGKVLFSYLGPDSHGQVVSGTISGTDITFESSVEFSSASTVSVTSIIFDTNASKAVIAYKDSGDSNKGKALVYQPINITRGQVTNGQAASVDVIGSVSDNQIGLTAGQQYFVQNDGTISTTAGSPSVLAGTAISATELVVKT